MERHDITEQLVRWADGDDRAFHGVIQAAYDELRRIARNRLARERGGHTLQPTALVNEACLRLLQQEHPPAVNRAQLFGVAGLLMRRILVDHARAKRGPQRGGGVPHVALSEAGPIAASPAVDVLALDLALQELESRHPRKARVVELRYFAGLTVPEVADALGVSSSSIEKDWAFARGWLRRRLSRESPGEAAPDQRP